MGPRDPGRPRGGQGWGSHGCVSSVSRYGSDSHRALWLTVREAERAVCPKHRRGAGTGGWGSSCVLKAGSARPKTVPPRRESKPAPREGGRSPSPRQLLALSEEEAPRALDTCRPRCSRHGRPPPPLRPPQAEGPSDRPPAHSWHPALFAQQRVCQTHFSWFQPLYKTDSSDFSSLFWHRGKKM